MISVSWANVVRRDTFTRSATTAGQLRGYAQEIVAFVADVELRGEDYKTYKQLLA